MALPEGVILPRDLLEGSDHLTLGKEVGRAEAAGLRMRLEGMLAVPEDEGA